MTSEVQFAIVNDFVLSLERAANSIVNGMTILLYN